MVPWLSCGDDTLHFDRFYDQLTGGLNQGRLACVEGIFQKLDENHSGRVSCEQLRIAFATNCHPKVISNEIT